MYELPLNSDCGTLYSYYLALIYRCIHTLYTYFLSHIPGHWSEKPLWNQVFMWERFVTAIFNNLKKDYMYIYCVYVIIIIFFSPLEFTHHVKYLRQRNIFQYKYFFYYSFLNVPFESLCIIRIKNLSDILQLSMYNIIYDILYQKYFKAKIDYLYNFFIAVKKLFPIFFN